MSCPNCKIFHSKCKASCCGPVPINREVFNKNFHLVQRPIKNSFIEGPNIIPVTEDLTCVFLSPDFECKIYPIRPDVCRKFGDESHPLMTCPYQKADGKKRSEKETQKIIKQQQNKII